VAQDVELRHREIASSTGKKKMAWRIRRFDRVDNRVGRAERIARLLAGVAAQLTDPRARRGSVVVDSPLGFVRRN